MKTIYLSFVIIFVVILGGCFNDKITEKETFYIVVHQNKTEIYADNDDEVTFETEVYYNSNELVKKPSVEYFEGNEKLNSSSYKTNISGKHEIKIRFKNIEKSIIVMAKIGIKNQIIEEAVMNLLKKKEGDVLTQEDVDGIKEMNLSNMGLSNIKGLELFKNLEYLNLSNNRISDGENLKGLIKLKELIINNNQLSDVSFIENMVDLRKLNIRANFGLSKYEAIKSKILLEDLNISFTNCKMDSVSQLVNLKTLEALEVPDFSFEALKNNLLLENLRLGFTSFAGLKGIEILTNIKSLDFFECNIQDITGLENLPNLKYLSIYKGVDTGIGTKNNEVIEKLKSNGCTVRIS